MNYEHKSNLRKALISQTWNKRLASAILNAVEEDLKRPQPQKGQSNLQLAIEKEKIRNKEIGLFHNIDDHSEE